MSDVKNLIQENEQLKKKLAELEVKLSESQENLKGYEADYDELCDETESLKSELATLAQEEEEKDADEEKKEEADEDEKEAKSVKVTYEEEEAEDEEKEEAEDEEEAEDDNEKQALALAKSLKALGIEPISTKPKAVALTQSEIFQRFAELTNPKEKASFYAEHRNQLFN